MHVGLHISAETILMASDTLSSMQPVNEGNNISISVDTASEDEATRIFNGLAEGGQITMPLDKTFWGAYFGMCTDAFGINWMVNYDYPKEG
jgi:PhnB protein